jgi:thiol reductant ABC exporter CydD subunit
MVALPGISKMRKISGVSRGFLGAFGLICVVQALVTVAQASLLADLLSRAFHHEAIGTTAGWFILAASGRATTHVLRSALARRTAIVVKRDLRGRAMAAIRELGPTWLGRRRAGELGTLLTRGLDALDLYLTGYVPHLITAGVVPLMVLISLAAMDWTSAVIVAVTLPLIPLFAALVGMHTRDRTRLQWQALSRLGGHFLDVISGLPTLVSYGRAAPQADVVGRIADTHRKATMKALRLAFLSTFVLETTATLSAALVAVPVSLRLLHGALTLRTALTVVILAPEAFLPLRDAGSGFHASAEGLAALEHVTAILDEAPEPIAGGATQPAVRGAPRIDVEEVTVRYPGEERAALHDVSFSVAPGERVAIAWPSGAGKSTLLGVLLGFVVPSGGRVLVDGTDLAEFCRQAWWRSVAWVPQRPRLFEGTIADNIGLAVPGASRHAVRRAADLAGVTAFADDLPAGLGAVVDHDGVGLSAGQRQRIALARALLLQAPLVLLDEPTARLDGETESAIARAVAELPRTQTVIIAGHRHGLIAAADRVIPLPGHEIRAIAARGQARC